MNKILFRIKRFEVKVKHLLLLLLLLFLLFILFLCMNKQKKTNEKANIAVVDTCTISDTSMIKLEQLILRSDLCSEDWYQDLDIYMNSLKTEIKKLESKTGVKDKQLKVLKEAIYNALSNFKEKQGEKEIDQLQQAMNNYKTYYRKDCK